MKEMNSLKANCCTHWTGEWCSCDATCHTPQQANYVNVWRPVKCGHCDPQYAEAMKKAEAIGYVCDCVCHDPKTEQEKDWLDEHHEKKVNELIGKPTDASWEERVVDLLHRYKVEGFTWNHANSEMLELIRKVREEAYRSRDEEVAMKVQDALIEGRRRAVEDIKRFAAISRFNGERYFEVKEAVLEAASREI